MAEKRPSDWRAQWDALKREAVHLEGQATEGLKPGHPKVVELEAAIAALNASKADVAHAIWLTTARDLDDLQLLAEIVFDQWWDIATFPQYPAGIDDRADQEVALAYLVRGVFAVAHTIAEGKHS
jgi:hypothetical protein